MEGIEKIKQTIDDILEVIPDVKEAKESNGKISLLEGSTLVLKHGGKAIRLVSAIEEIGKEVKDIDDVEAGELFDQLDEHFGGSDESKAAVKKIIAGAASISQGIQGLIALKDEKE